MSFPTVAPPSFFFDMPGAGTRGMMSNEPQQVLELSFGRIAALGTRNSADQRILLDILEDGIPVEEREVVAIHRQGVDYRDAVMLARPDGGFSVLWQEVVRLSATRTETTLMMRNYDAAGQAEADPVALAEGGTSPGVASGFDGDMEMMPDGRLAVASYYSDIYGGATSELLFFDEDGTAAGSRNLPGQAELLSDGSIASLSTNSTANGQQLVASITAEDGSVVMPGVGVYGSADAFYLYDMEVQDDGTMDVYWWQDDDGTQYLHRRVTPDGTRSQITTLDLPEGARPFRIDIHATDTGFVMFWQQDGSSPARNRIYLAQHYDAAGAMLGGPQPLTERLDLAGTNATLEVLRDAAGGLDLFLVEGWGAAGRRFADDPAGIQHLGRHAPVAFETPAEDRITLAGPGNIDAGAGDDTVIGSDGADRITGGAGDDFLAGRPGNDLFLLSAGADTVNGGAGLDTLFIDGIDPEDVTTLYQGGSYLINAGGTVQTLLGIEFVAITWQGETTSYRTFELLANQGPDTLIGTEGADILRGGPGDDSLRGLGGDDQLFGDEGRDTLVGDAGNDTLTGGDSAGDLRDDIFGEAGDDLIFGGAGNDFLYGGTENDTIDGGAGVDTIVGQAGDDVLSGGSLSDAIFGSDGADFLNGGFGFDRLNGGAGADRFFHLGVQGHGSDWIQDYASADGDVLQFGGAGASAADFQVNFADTANAGAAGVDEAFVIYIPTRQILWALVDGGGEAEINLGVGGQTFDLLA